MSSKPIPAHVTLPTTEQIAWGSLIASEYGHTGGSQTLGTVAFLVPRSIWPEKPEDTGIILAKAAKFGNTSLSAPLWIEGYLDGGVPLLAVAFAWLGLAHKRIEEGAATMTTGAAIFSVYQLVILRGSLIASMAISAALYVVYRCLFRRVHDSSAHQTT